LRVPENSGGAEFRGRGRVAMSEDYVLETQDLIKEFAGFAAVLSVNLRVARGSIHALIAPNGATKTTCFNLLTKFPSPTSSTLTSCFRNRPMRTSEQYFYACSRKQKNCSRRKNKRKND